MSFKSHLENLFRKKNMHIPVTLVKTVLDGLAIYDTISVVSGFRPVGLYGGVTSAEAKQAKKFLKQYNFIGILAKYSIKKVGSNMFVLYEKSHRDEATYVAKLFRRRGDFTDENHRKLGQIFHYPKCCTEKMLIRGNILKEEKEEELDRKLRIRQLLNGLKARPLRGQVPFSKCSSFCLGCREWKKVYEDIEDVVKKYTSNK